MSRSACARSISPSCDKGTPDGAISGQGGASSENLGADIYLHVSVLNGSQRLGGPRVSPHERAGGVLSIGNTVHFVREQRNGALVFGSERQDDCDLKPADDEQRCPKRPSPECRPVKRRIWWFVGPALFLMIVLILLMPIAIAGDAQLYTNYSVSEIRERFEFGRAWTTTTENLHALDVSKRCSGRHFAYVLRGRAAIRRSWSWSSAPDQFGDQALRRSLQDDLFPARHGGPDRNGDRLGVRAFTQRLASSIQHACSWGCGSFLESLESWYADGL